MVIVSFLLNFLLRSYIMYTTYITIIILKSIFKNKPPFPVLYLKQRDYHLLFSSPPRCLGVLLVNLSLGRRYKSLWSHQDSQKYVREGLMAEKCS